MSDQRPDPTGSSATRRADRSDRGRSDAPTDDVGRVPIGGRRARVDGRDRGRRAHRVRRRDARRGRLTRRRRGSRSRDVRGRRRRAASSRGRGCGRPGVRSPSLGDDTGPARPRGDRGGAGRPVRRRPTSTTRVFLPETSLLRSCHTTSAAYEEPPSDDLPPSGRSRPMIADRCSSWAASSSVRSSSRWGSSSCSSARSTRAPQSPRLPLAIADRQPEPVAERRADRRGFGTVGTPDFQGLSLADAQTRGRRRSGSSSQIDDGRDRRGRT